MKANVLLIETQGTVLQKLKQNFPISGLNIDMLYMKDPQIAINIIAQRNVGVVVVNFGNDLKGCHEFCLKVRDQFSAFIRVVLLTEEQNIEVGNKIKYAHQTLASSCSEKEFVVAIDRLIQVSSQVQQNPKLVPLLSKLDSLPSPPSVYFALREQLSLPIYDSGLLTELISFDQAVAANILRMANSGFYAVPHTISDLRQAITLLGKETLSDQLLATHLFDSLPLPGLNLDNLCTHAVGVARMARFIAQERGADREQIEASSIAGLLHDLGSLVFIVNQPAKYQVMLRNANGDEGILVAMEREEFGIDHGELGGIVLLLWGLPDSIVNAVKFHHEYKHLSSLQNSSTTWDVCVAEWIVNFSLSQGGVYSEDGMSDIPFDCNAEQVDHWRTMWKQIQIQIQLQLQVQEEI